MENEWRVHQAEGNCTGCGTDLYMRFEAQGEGTDQQLAARYVMYYPYPCPNCGTPMTPEIFDPDFVPAKFNNIVYYAEGSPSDSPLAQR